MFTTNSEIWSITSVVSAVPVWKEIREFIALVLREGKCSADAILSFFYLDNIQVQLQDTISTLIKSMIELCELL